MRGLGYVGGVAGALVLYPLAERWEKRSVWPKLAELRRHYRRPYAERRGLVLEQLARTLEFAQAQVPYYGDTFRAARFDPGKVRRDARFLEDAPYLTKEIIREQGARLLSRSLDGVRHHACKTGGSTGASCTVFYDQAAADRAAAVILFARSQIGKRQYLPETHFASRFPEVFPLRDRLREHVKCLTMNRSNIFFDRLDDAGLEQIWDTLRRRRAYLVHSHPSTMYSLACYVERTYGAAKVFEVFESSGELLEGYMREKIGSALRCRVVDRYGLAEVGVMAYETEPGSGRLSVFDSEGWLESCESEAGDTGPGELVVTGFRNALMPLIRYRTADRGRVEETPEGVQLWDLVGRIHDVFEINGVAYASHFVQDVLDRVGGVQEFQVDLRNGSPRLLVVPEPAAEPEGLRARLAGWWGDGLEVEFVGHDDLVRVGERAKFRRVIRPARG